MSRTIKAVAAPAILDFPGAVQAAQLRHTRTVKGKKSVEVVYVITSMTAQDGSPDQIATWVVEHWSIENRLHWVRDVTFDEDRPQIRTGNGPRAMATLRSTAISLVRLNNIVQSCDITPATPPGPSHCSWTAETRLCRGPAIRSLCSHDLASLKTL